MCSAIAGLFSMFNLLHFSVMVRHCRFILPFQGTAIINLVAGKAEQKAEPPSLFFMSTSPHSFSLMIHPPSWYGRVRGGSIMNVEAPVRCTGSASSSPEFEFWMVRNPSFPPPDLLTADELFFDGVLLPLQLLSLPSTDRPALQHSNPPSPPAEPTASILHSSSSISSRWKDLFKSTAEKKRDGNDRRKKERRTTSGGHADLNINLNIWPFTRSRSAVGRPRSATFVASRNISSAPCSRSNSNGESPGGMRLGETAGRSAVAYLGRSSPVLQLRRAGVGAKEKEKLWIPSVSAAGGNGGTAGVRALNLNVNSSIGFGKQVSLTEADSDEITSGGRTADGSIGGNKSAFNLGALFSKKVH